jgi:hypothetical protein
MDVRDGEGGAGLDFADATKDELISHIMLQRTLIRRLYRKIVDLEAAAKMVQPLQQQGLTRLTAEPTTSSRDGGAAFDRLPHQQFTSPVPNSRQPAGGEVEQSLRRIEGLLQGHYRGTDPLDAPTVNELEGLQEKLSGAYGGYRHVRGADDVQQYKQNVLDGLDEGILKDGEGAAPLLAVGVSPRSPVSRNQRFPEMSPVNYDRNSVAGSSHAQEFGNAAMKRFGDSGFLPEKLPSPKRSGTYRPSGPSHGSLVSGAVAQTPPPPSTLLHLLQRRYSSPQPGIGSALTSPRDVGGARRVLSPSKAARRQRVL